jgi:hypothetical protein
MLNEESSAGIGELLLLLIESHSWLEIFYLALAIYVIIPTKLIKADWVVPGADYVTAKASKWPENFIQKLLAPFLLILIFLTNAMIISLYSIFGLTIGIIVEYITQVNDIFNYPD